MSENGTPFQCIDSFLKAPKWPKNNALDSIIIAIDQFHKISLIHFRNLLNVIPKSYYQKIHLVVSGSMYEKGCNPYRGGGNLFLDLLNRFPSTELCLDHYTHHPLWSSYCSIVEKKPYNIEFDKLVEDNWSNLTEYIKILTRGVKSKGVTYYQIFCSTKTNKQNYLSKIAKKLPYREKTFTIGDDIHIVDLDVIGTIHKAYNKTISGNRGSEITTKDCLTLPGGMTGYILEVKLQQSNKIIEYHTKNHKITHSYIMTISEYNGLPVDHGLFIIDGKNNFFFLIFISAKRTNNMDLLSALKYCKKSFKIFALEPDEFIHIYSNKCFFPHTGLGDKLKTIPLLSD